jgi:DNA-directed RNA polymerase specialized sigma24 family protein
MEDEIDRLAKRRGSDMSERVAMQEAFKHLAPVELFALQLHADGLSDREIGVLIDKSDKTAKKTYQRATDIFMQHYKEADE